MRSNPFEQHARLKKVLRLVDTIDLLPSVSAEQLRSADATWWKGAAMLANVKPPSQATVDAVIAVYERRQGVPRAGAL